MQTQVGCVFVDKVTPSLTDLRELAPPPKSVIPAVLLIQSIVVEYAKEYIIRVVESLDSRILCVVSSPAEC